MEVLNSIAATEVMMLRKEPYDGCNFKTDISEFKQKEGMCYVKTQHFHSW